MGSILAGLLGEVGIRPKIINYKNTHIDLEFIAAGGGRFHVNRNRDVWNRDLNRQRDIAALKKRTLLKGYSMHSVPNFNHRLHAIRGFTLIELMIVVAIIAIILTLALPVYTEYNIRKKVGEVLSVGAGAKAAVASTCVADPTIDPLTNAGAGFALVPSKYIFSITVSGPCTDPVITIQTQNLGVSPDIVITLTGDMPTGEGRLDWTCTSNTSNNNVPSECRT